MAANFAKLLGQVRGTVEAAGQRLFAFHFSRTSPRLIPSAVVAVLRSKFRRSIN